MNRLPLALLLIASLSLTACGEKSTKTHAAEEGHAPKASAEAEHGHGHGGEGEKLTHFSDRTELFVEFPHLVVGEKAAFAAHLTHLADFKAVTAGKVTLRLSGGGKPDEVFSVDGPSQPGIFRPEAIPKHAGERELSIALASPQFSVTHALGKVSVYADDKALEAQLASKPAEHEDEGIGFTKEQQWKVDFALAEAIKRPIRTAINATGSLRARPDGEALLTAQASGQIRSTGAFPRLGQAVQKGQVLAYLVPRLGGETDLASLEVAERKARVELDLAERELTRLEGLFREEAVAEKRVQAARAVAASARAEHDATRQRLGQFAGNSGGVPIRAPVAGTLVDVRVSPGAYAQEGAALFHIADRRNLWLELRVPEAEAARLSSRSPGRPKNDLAPTGGGAGALSDPGAQPTQPSGAAFRVASMERSLEIILGKNGRLIAVGGVVDATSRTVPVVFEFSSPDAQLPVGMAVQGQIFVGNPRDSVAIPAASVLDENGMSIVFVQLGGESFERRTLRLGAREGDWVEVLDGLKPGERVVSKGAYLIKLAATGTAQIGHGHAH